MKRITKARIHRAQFHRRFSASVFIAAVLASAIAVACYVREVTQPGILASITVTPPNATIAAGSTQQMTAIGYDASGRVVSISPTWSIAAGGGAISPTGLFTAGTVAGFFANTVVASVGSISGRASITVTLGALASITITPSSVALAASGTQQFVAVGTDAGGNIVPIAATWSVVAGGGAMNGAGLFTAGTTAGTFTNTVRATSGTLSGTATVIVTSGSLASITVTPNPDTLAAGTRQRFVAVGKDANGNIVPVDATWSVVAGGGVMDADGLFTAGATVGTFTNTIKATSGSLSGTATVVVTAASLVSITVISNPITIEVNGTNRFVAVGRDAYGNAVPVKVTWAIVAGGGTVDSTGVFTAGTVAGTFANTVRATSGGLSGTVTVVVIPGPLASLTVTPNQASVPAYGIQQFMASGKDRHGNTLPIVVAWSVVAGGGLIDQAGLFTAGTVVGTFTNTVVATSDPRSATATVVVTSGPLAFITVTPNPASMPANGVQQFTAVGTDAFGNTVPIIPTWSVVSGGGTVNATGLFTAGTTAGTFTKTIKAISGTLAGTATVVVGSLPLATITVTPNLATMLINGVQQFIAVGRDIAGNVLAITPTWAVVASGGTIDAAGLFTAGTTAGTFANTVKATSGTLSGTATVNVSPGPLATITLTPSPATVFAGGTQQFVAVGRDASGNIVPVTPSWSVVAGGGTIDPAGIFTAGSVAGTFANTVKATIGAQAATATVNVTAGPLASITVSPNPAMLPINGALQFTAAGMDANGNVQPIAATWSVVAGGGSVDAGGLFTAGTTAGTFANTVKATVGALSGTATVVESAGPLASIVMTPNPATLPINGAQQFSALGRDVAGNPVAIVPTWAVVASGGTINGTGLFTAGSVSGTFPNTVRATSGALSGTATVNVTAGPLASITVSPSPATVAVSGTQQFSALGQDAGGNVVPFTPTWSIVAGGGSVNAGGLFTAGATTGTFAQTVKATSGALSGTATVVVTSGALARVTVTPSAATIPINGAQQFTAVGADAHGNAVSIEATWSVVAGGGAIDPTGRFTAGAAAGTFTNTVMATSGALRGTATVTVSAGALASLTVTPSAATMPIGGAQQFVAVGRDASGNTVPVTPAWAVVASGGTIDGTGLFTAGTRSGTFANTVKATSGAISGTATVTVTAGPLALIAVTPNPVSMTISGTQQFTVTGRDANGNVVAITPVWAVVANGGTIDTAGLFTAGTTAGTFNNTVKATSGAFAGTATVVVTAGPLANLTVTPNPATLTINGTQRFTATGTDANGNTAPVAPTWSVVAGGGSADSAGFFTAGTVSATFTNTVKATSGGISGFATVVVSAGPLTTISVTPNPATLTISGTQQFTVTGRDANGNVVAITPTWTVVASGGTIDGTGLFTAGTMAGTFANTVKATSGTFSGTATVNITAGPLATITVTPNPARLNLGDQQQFVAVGTDVGGNTVPITPAWSVVAFGGSIDAAGLFTAGATPGTFANTVTATSGTLSGTATVISVPLPGLTTAFEDFSPGGIDQQHDWKSLGGLGAPPPVNPLDTHCRVYDHEIVDNTAAMSDYSYPSFARYSLRMSNAVVYGCFTDQVFSNRTLDFAGQAGAWSTSANGLVEFALPGGVLKNHFEAEWSFASTVPLAEQPGLAVVASPARGDDARMSWVQMADLPDGLAVVFAERSTPASPVVFQLSTVAHGLDRSVPHTIKISMDFADGPDNDVVRVFVDGALKHTGTSWENYYYYDANGRRSFGGNPPIVNRIMFRTGSDASGTMPGGPAPATRGHGFVFDNLRQATYTVAVPPSVRMDNR